MTSLARRPVTGGIEDEARILARLLEEAVARRVKGRSKVAVSFSGGLDSSLIAYLAAKRTKVVLCSAYTGKSADHGRTSRAAESLSLDRVGKVLEPRDVANEIKDLDLPFVPGPMDKALWCLFSSTARMAAEAGAELMLLGQLADELFGGYLKYSLRAKESETSAVEMMESDVAASSERAFIRDEQACSRYVEAGFPFADHDLAGFALSLPIAYKIRAGERKAILRLAASILGLPEDLVRAPKKAAQYSSGLSKLVG